MAADAGLASLVDSEPPLHDVPRALRLSTLLTHVCVAQQQYPSSPMTGATSWCVSAQPSLTSAHSPALLNQQTRAQGILRGYDQATNLILDECHERVYSSKVRAVLCRHARRRCRKPD